MKNKPVILVVDDQPQNSELLEAYLAPKGYEIVKAASGEEALGVLSGTAIDLILMDILMPGMDGFEVTRRVRQDNRHRQLPIILITALSEPEDRVKGSEAGCDDFLSKPVNKMELFARVRSLLKVKAYNDLMSDYQEELEAKVTSRTKDLKHAVENLQQEITERKLVEEALRMSEGKYRWLLNHMADVITVMDMNLRFTYVSPSIVRMRGYTAEEVLTQTLEQAMTPESLQVSAKVFEEEMTLEASGTAAPNRTRMLVVEQYRKDGSIVLVENHLSFLRDEAQKAVGIISVSHDITARKEAEDKVKKQTDAIEASIDGIALVNEDEEYIYLNQAYARIYGYENAGELFGKSWRTLYDADEIQRFDAEIMPKLGQSLYWQGTALGMKKDGSKFTQEISLTALGGGGLVYVVRDITDRQRAEEALRNSESQYRLLAENVSDVIYVLDMDFRYTYISPSVKILQGFEPAELLNQPANDTVTPSSAALIMKALSEVMELEKSGHGEVPIARTLAVETIRKDGTIVWTEEKFSLIKDEKKQPFGILGISRDITERKQSEENLRKILESLRKAFGGTIQVLASSVEIRDPYTAGHQIRAANLAIAIAIEMGLPQEKTEGIRMAGYIHDIGKLSVPAEILSKPGKLSEIEFSLIKEHARRGYEMLKDVEFPWPLAQIIYQHHERMDGSGYPQNLKGDEILMEARIMAVADVVESMASQRPYRPALGIDAALEEIEGNKGILYDDAVAEACLKLFREKGFQL